MLDTGFPPTDDDDEDSNSNNDDDDGTDGGMFVLAVLKCVCVPNVVVVVVVVHVAITTLLWVLASPLLIESLVSLPRLFLCCRCITFIVARIVSDRTIRSFVCWFVAWDYVV